MKHQLTRSTIKSIVKECLIEILEEGISGGRQSMLESSRKKDSRKNLNSDERPPQRTGKRPPQRRRALDNIRMDQAQASESINQNFEKNISKVANSMTSDPILSSILADTAKTTLQEQIGAESRGPGGVAMPTSLSGDAAARKAASSTPDDLFAGSAEKWADLAFAAPVNKR